MKLLLSIPTMEPPKTVKINDECKYMDADVSKNSFHQNFFGEIDSTKITIAINELVQNRSV